MSEVKVNNGNIEDALKRFKKGLKDNVQEMEYCKRLERESIMKNQA